MNKTHLLMAVGVAAEVEMEVEVAAINKATAVVVTNEVITSSPRPRSIS